ncbi:unnamed protein product [Protopolystoma xenopodis]|uniref:Uncharacterized protein n=1 Tax=Protopolystoma xenopodis TaxID=117903 RepID=A0A3S5FH65_9PLAT|nr:unnamed protein product [Protopolystoma xenopodis]
MTRPRGRLVGVMGRLDFASLDLYVGLADRFAFLSVSPLVRLTSGCVWPRVRERVPAGLDKVKDIWSCRMSFLTSELNVINFE